MKAAFYLSELEPMMVRTWPTLFVTLLSILVFAGCRADDETKRGAEGEFCGGADNACRVGLTCVDGICESPVSDLDFDCTDVCETLRSCGTLEQGCPQACAEAIEDWSPRAIESFGQCFAEDVTCEIASDDPQQFCYDNIEIPDVRSERCSLFAETVRSCDEAADTEDLRRSCFRTARVGTDEAWSATARCEDAVETGICSGFGTCLNEVFDTSYSLPDNEI